MFASACRVIFACVVLATLPVRADTPDMPSDAQIREVMRDLPTIPTNDDLRKKMSDMGVHRKANEGFQKITPEMLQNHPGKDIGNIQVSPQKVDFDRLAERFREFKPGRNAELKGPRVYVFVSFGMPSASMERVIADAERSHAILVLRGLVNNSFKETAKAVTGIVGKRTVGWYIDPTLYERYQVRQIPAVALVLREEKSCSRGQVCKANDQDYLLVSGDVPIAYALEHIARLRPAAKPAAAPYLKRLGVKS